jgi:hypothetical protein
MHSHRACVCVFEIESVKHVRSFIPIFRVGTQKTTQTETTLFRQISPPTSVSCLFRVQTSAGSRAESFSLLFRRGEGPNWSQNEAQHQRENLGENNYRFIFYFRPIVKPLKDLTSTYFPAT